MAKSNRERVGEIMDLLKSGLGPYVLQQYKFVYKSKHLQEIELFLYQPGKDSLHLPDEAAALNAIDTQAWLKLMFHKWNEVFKEKLGHNERSYVSELMTQRNQWAHQSAFSTDDARRAADNAARLLRAVSATNEAESADEHSRQLMHELLQQDGRRSTRKQRGADNTLIAKTGLKPWRMVIQPHDDVLSGDFVNAEFAANLAKVLSGRAVPEYGDAKEFFRRTYLTEGLSDLIINSVKRLSGQGGDPVVQLQTNFGGGKTHSMIALYHAFGPDIKLNELPDYHRIASRVGATDDIHARRAVIVGDALNPSQPKQHHDCTTYTLWGEIAYQLGGLDGYAMLEENDLQGTNPGSDSLEQLLEAHGPALIIIDELVHYARGLYNVSERQPAGTFDTVLSFAQSLTTAVSNSSNSLLLVSLPTSEIEIGGQGGKDALARLSKTIGRMESVWKPVEPAESYEIVRRRLFSEVDDISALNATVSAFSELYRRGKADFPMECKELPYKNQMTDAYPIHPELFERLYKDWTTLETFQSTRGVLRLMATVIYQLWNDDDDSFLIMPGSIPLANSTVKSEILRYLPSNFPAVVDADIDGESSTPSQIERDVTLLKRHKACRRVARAIFVGSAPSVREQGVRGIDEKRINLGTVQPSERASTFSDALRRMSNQLTYLYNDGTRYWYDTRATVNRTAEDRAQGMDEYEVLKEAHDRLKLQNKDSYRSLLGSVHIMPEGSAEIPDEQSARVIVLGPDCTHKSNDSASAAMQEITEIMNSRGNSPRHHRNMLVFIAPDETRNAELTNSIRKYLAWKSIERDAATLNLDHQQSKQVEEAVKREGETVDEQLQETYSWLIVPLQPDLKQPVELSQERLSGKNPFLERAARKLKSNEWLIHGLSPNNLLMELEPLDIWKNEPHLSVKKLWEWLTNYCYLPRLADQSVLEATIKNGVEDMFPAFAYATGVDEDGKYTGLAMGRPFTLYFDSNALIVKPDVARAQIDAEIADKEEPGPPIVHPPPPGPVGPVSPPLAKPKTRFYATKRIDATDAKRDLNQIADEIVRQLASLPGAISDISIDISGYCADGFDDATVRTLSENSRTLGLDEFGFEDD